MLPLQQAFEVRTAIEEYLKATFGFRNREVSKPFYAFINHPDDGIFKGPYISLKLPFLAAPANAPIPLTIQPRFTPYLHQFEAFKRLTTADGQKPQPTIVTTGTSSGKTESFLFPLLDYCYKNAHRPGIKAIILYPMNALATDQAKRLAKLIWEDERLKGKITAGLFIGEGSGGKKREQDMGADHIIEDRKTIYGSPPDILLTNFKMLDFGLMKGEYDSLWHFNYKDRSLLSFLVLDELHTYDGAQGTDVANLIRRLKLKLQIPQGQICPVGTSATIGSGPESKEGLVKYAAQVFGEAIDITAIIGEERMELDAYLPDANDDFSPRLGAIPQSRMGMQEDYQSYLRRQRELWQLPVEADWVAIAGELKKLKIVKDLLTVTTTGMAHYDDLMRELAILNPDFGKIPENDASFDYSPRGQLLQSLLALLSAARVQNGNQEMPFMYVQVQLWLRELTGVLRRLEEEPSFSWKRGHAPGEDAVALPPWFCRECGSSGWLAVKHDNNPDALEQDVNQVYQHFFDHHKNLYFMLPANEPCVEEYKPSHIIDTFINKHTCQIHQNPGKDRMKMLGYRLLRTDNQNKARHVCPSCNTEDAIAIIGTRVATLSSITISQVLSSNLDERDNQSRKILCFTNSVQDAAHQAGFVEARNYRFTFRASLQQVLNHIDKPVSLEALQQTFIEYWKDKADETGQKDIEAYVYRFFPDDYRGKANLESDYRDNRTRKFSPQFLKELDTRLTWEIAAEFGYNAQVGRTLEKSGASAVSFDEEKIKAVFAIMHPWLHANMLGTIEQNAMDRFVQGILHRIRIRGALDHPFLQKFRTNKLEQWDLNWNKDPRHFLNRYFGSRSRFPRMLVHNPLAKETVDNTYTLTGNWFQAYYRKSFLLAPTENKALLNEFFQALLQTMANVGLLNTCTAGSLTNYAISPEAVIAHNKVVRYGCNTCNSQLQTTINNVFAAGTPCLDYRCTGFYEQLPEVRLNYYQQVYNRSRSPRIYASEHTGMLPRDRREQVEKSFKERPKFNSLNTLVATSTLEMGINIGTLNAAINNSVPPATANFLQRVGRAGRATGAALITNFALSKNHDLYHFAEPKGMMEGEIQVPGCFLQAREILRRHFFAFCLDTWAAANPLQNRFPVWISRLQLLNTNLDDSSFLINRLLSFIKAKEADYLGQFQSIYSGDDLPQQLFDDLATSLHTDDWYRDIRQVFAGLKKELQDLMDRASEIDTTVRERQLAKTDPEYDELMQEKRSIIGLKKIIGRRSPLEHLTNRGLLPNYAFPETGVKLQASIRAFSAKESTAPPINEEFEIVRDAATSLSELAPHNDFYGLGYKFHISGLNTYDWKDPSTLQVMRFCSNCDHIEHDAKAKGTACPKCDDASWGAASNKHKYVKLSAVRSNNLRDEATLDDSSEERKPVMYRRTRHLQFDKESSQGAIGMKEIPFGVEYVKNITCTEVNMGLKDVMSSNRININQLQDVPRHGFITCRHCGRSHGNPNLVNMPGSNRPVPWHYPWCKRKDDSYKGAADEVFEEIFLYREMRTEALKILLPVQEFDSDEKIQMFTAGLQAGLRLYYKGNPGHIGTWDYREFNRQTLRFDRYLVLYDTIPGGTGYLEKLFDKERFTALLKLAYLHLKECACQHRGKDGCYRCIFTYRNQYVQESLSRQHAEQLFEKLINNAATWEYLPYGLGTLSGTGQIEESELEDRFIRSLKNKVHLMKGDHWDWREDRVGTIRYHLTLSRDEWQFGWQITPQVSLGYTQGVSISTRADFEMVITSIKQNGEEIKDARMLDAIPRWIIYLDGYDYHASKENLRFYNDIQKRMALVASGRYLSYSLTWQDLDRFDKNLVAKPNALDMDLLYPDRNRFGETMQKLMNHPMYAECQSNLLNSPDAMDRLLWMLTHPFESDRPDKKNGLLLAMMQEKFGVPSFDETQIPQRLFADDLLHCSATQKSGGKFYMLSKASRLFPFVSLTVAIHAGNLSMACALKWDEKIQAIDKDEWASFWPVFNLVQQSVTTRSGALEMISEKEDTSLSGWKIFYSDDLHEIVEAFLAAGLEVNPDGGFFLDEIGFAAAEAELGNKEKKLFIRAISDEDKELFLEAGYREITFESFNPTMLA
jgi:DEAD/DEAH box helicase domain-containing protein